MQNSGYICQEIQELLGECIYDFEKTSAFVSILTYPWNRLKEIFLKKEKEKKKDRRTFKSGYW